MFAPFLIMLREGLEAALIIGILCGYLTRTGRRALLPAIWSGILLALSLALLTGAVLIWLDASFPQKAQELLEAGIGIVAYVFLITMVLWMRKFGRSVKSDLQHQMDAAFSSGTTWSLVLLSFAAVAREGLESVFFLLAIFQQSAGWQAPIGALLGIVLAIGVGWLIHRGALHVNLGKFFHWTSIFIVLIAAGIAASVPRALHEAGIWNHLQQPIWNLSGTLPESSLFGTILSGFFGYRETLVLGELLVYLVALLIPLAWLLRPVKSATEARHVRP
ncbi:iron uptake transporter permease EfeU [Paracoccus aminophilus]|uniref:Iron permease n=1 Tax=Paracoccus aminophilus JCM 7686 TaxID=1367847 RepID=S5XLL5_PARAH|nr:iron uptake transporter permease EfeU [Paracoccus aminophilus]AGT08094.1 iron permease [Paracoccus aminophilus JCM 7686]